MRNKPLKHRSIHAIGEMPVVSAEATEQSGIMTDKEAREIAAIVRREQDEVFEILADS